MIIREKGFDYPTIDLGDRALTLGGGNKLIGSHYFSLFV
jgi:hypothetical protein